MAHNDDKIIHVLLSGMKYANKKDLVNTKRLEALQDWQAFVHSENTQNFSFFKI